MQSPQQFQQERREWNNSLCGCMSNTKVCCITCFCPCVTLGKNLQALQGRPHWLIMAAGVVFQAFAGCSFLIPFEECFIRYRIRKYLNIKGNLCLDFLTALFCMSCALCQEANEMQSFEGGPAGGGARPITQQPQGMQMQQYQGGQMQQYQGVQTQQPMQSPPYQGQMR